MPEPIVDDLLITAGKFLVAFFVGLTLGPNRNATVWRLMVGTLALIGIIFFAIWRRRGGRWR